MKALYPEIEPYRTFHLDAGGKHRVYVEECGNSEGFPVIFLHGGPASGCKPGHRRFFDPEKYRIILFDQRGCGRSEPYGELEQNTTPYLIEDMEGIRRQLGIERWLLFGGSWGAALGLLYAQAFPSRVAGMILRGTFLARRRDLDWFVRDGVNRIYPEQWQRLADSVAACGKGDIIEAIRRCLWSDDPSVQLRVAREWWSWSSRVAEGEGFDVAGAEVPIGRDTLLKVRMELHYATNHYFIDEDQILNRCETIRHIPATLIHGRYDLVCPMEAGFSLHRALPEAEFRVLPRSGHIARGEEMEDALVTAADAMVRRLMA